jgi:hypothetical protein
MAILGDTGGISRDRARYVFRNSDFGDVWHDAECGRKHGILQWLDHLPAFVGFDCAGLTLTECRPRSFEE